MHVVLLDWKMAFDKEDHESMCIAIERLGVHRHYIQVIRDLYAGQSFTTLECKDLKKRLHRTRASAKVAH